MVTCYSAVSFLVSIHAPREGCDDSHSMGIVASFTFQFTHPGRGATETNGEWNISQAFQFTHPGRGATF